MSEFEVLSTRSQNILSANDINSIESLIKLTPQDFLKLRNSGKKSLNEIRYFLIYRKSSLKNDIFCLEHLNKISRELPEDLCELERIYNRIHKKLFGTIQDLENLNKKIQLIIKKSEGCKGFNPDD